jgi:hypothetical protein
MLLICAPGSPNTACLCSREHKKCLRVLPGAQLTACLCSREHKYCFLGEQIAMGLEGYLALSFGIAQRGKFFVLLSCIVRTLLVTL